MCELCLHSTGYLEGGIVESEFLAKETACPKAGMCVEEDLLEEI